MTNEYIKPPVEIRYKNELDALKSVDIGKSLKIGCCRQRQCEHLY